MFNRSKPNLARRRPSPLDQRQIQLLSAVMFELRQRLQLEQARQHLGEIPDHLVAQALRDADSVAATNPYPHLVLPLLADEKIHAARQWHFRQKTILERSSLSLAE